MCRAKLSHDTAVCLYRLTIRQRPCNMPHRRGPDAKRFSRTREYPAKAQLDRPGRSLADLMRLPDDFKKRGVKFRSLTEANRRRNADRPRHVADDWRIRKT